MTLAYKGYLIKTQVIAGHARVWIEKGFFPAGYARSVSEARRVIDSRVKTNQE